LKVTKKLLLNKETIKALTSDDLQKVAGGTFGTYDSQGCATDTPNCFSWDTVSSGGGSTGSGSSICSVCATP
jgi:natural product precursor